MFVRKQVHLAVHHFVLHFPNRLHHVIEISGEVGGRLIKDLVRKVQFTLVIAVVALIHDLGRTNTSIHQIRVPCDRPIVGLKEERRENFDQSTIRQHEHDVRKTRSMHGHHHID